MASLLLLRLSSIVLEKKPPPPPPLFLPPFFPLRPQSVFPPSPVRASLSGNTLRERKMRPFSSVGKGRMKKGAFSGATSFASAAALVAGVFMGVVVAAQGKKMLVCYFKRG